MSESLEHLEGLRDLGLFSWEEAQGHLIIVWKCLRGGGKIAEPSGAQWWDQRQWHRLELRRCPLNIRKSFHIVRMTKQTRALVAQEYGTFVIGDIPKPSGHGPGQLLLGGPAWAGRLVYMTFTSPF